MYLKCPFVNVAQTTTFRFASVWSNGFPLVLLASFGLAHSIFKVLPFIYHTPYITKYHPSSSAINAHRVHPTMAQVRLWIPYRLNSAFLVRNCPQTLLALHTLTNLYIWLFTTMWAHRWLQLLFAPSQKRKASPLSKTCFALRFHASHSSAIFSEMTYVSHSRFCKTSPSLAVYLRLGNICFCANLLQNITYFSLNPSRSQ